MLEDLRDEDGEGDKIQNSYCKKKIKRGMCLFSASPKLRYR